jgi:acetylornithine deacetylase
MKGGLAAVLGAVAALRTAGVRLRRPVAVHCVVAEEDGGLGAFATLRRGHTGSACVIAEPTAGGVVPANAGSLTFRLEVRGLATHGSTRTRGVSAVDAFVPVLAALRELEARRNRDVPDVFTGTDLPYPLSVGTARAGEWASTVPDLLVAEGRYGVRLDEPVDEARAVFEAAVAEACAADSWLSRFPVRVSWPGGVFASGWLPAGDPLLPAVRSAVQDVTGREPAVQGAPYGSDLRLYAAAGVPTLQYGPGDVGHAHAVDEHVDVADLARAARVYALLATRLCGVAE